jgi:hypothetical protein
MLNPTDPFPVPAAPDVTVIHGTLLTAVHPHNAVVVTVAVPVLATAGAFWLVGLIAYVHAGGMVAPAACDTVNVRLATAIVPVRAAPVLAATLKVTTPLPVPLVPDVMVIHGTSVLAVHPHTLCPATANVPGPPAAVTFWLVGAIEMLQFTGAADCTTAARWPPTTMLPVRSPPGLVSTLKSISPDPVPLAGPVNEIQLTSADAVQAQSLSLAPTATVPVPPLVAIGWLDGVNVKRHGARCEMRACSLLTTIVPSRVEVPSLAEARNDTLPVPCPEAGDNPEIQLALVDAVQAHSGSVVTVIELVPPAASIWTALSSVT